MDKFEFINQWQPIDTAPSDGTVIDLWHSAHKRCCNVWWGFGKWQNTRIPSVDRNNFTHWMPLPDAPRA